MTGTGAPPATGDEADRGPAARAERVAPHVTVAALTFRRPDELRRLLPHLVDQAASIDPPAAVVIVDNDPDGAAEPVVRPWRDRGVTYVHEPSPGIAAGRNRALDTVRPAAPAQQGRPTAVVFIDDDETPRPGWLAALVTTWLREGTAAVGGPVVRDVSGLDPWIRATGLYEPYSFPTGTRVHGGATNNLLLDLGFLRATGLRFDERFGLTGGSDTMLLQSLLRRGGEIAWCEEAVVTDPVPAQRLTRAWVRRRYFRTGNTWARVQIALAGTPARRGRARLVHATTTFARLGKGTLVCLVGVVLRRTDLRARGAVRVVSSFGELWACAGRAHVEYRRR